MVSIYVLLIFCDCFASKISIHQLWSYHRNGQNSSQRLSLPPTPHHHLANNNRQRQVYLCCQFLCPFQFLQMFYSYISKKFKSSAMVLPRERLKLSPQTEFCLPPNTTALPTTRGSGGYIIVVSSCVLSIFYVCFIATSKKHLSHQQWSSHENGRNSAHRLSFASRPTPPPFQQQ